MVAIPVSLDTFHWATKTEALKAFRVLLNNGGYGIGDRIVAPDDERMLYEALERHPDATEKEGVGVDYFYVGETRQDAAAFVRKDARGFWIRRTDGSTVDFSYQTAIGGRNAKTDAKEAMRLAVQGTRLKFRDDLYDSRAPVLSSISGDPITARADAHVIYANPEWAQLTYRFAQTQGGWKNIKVTAGGGTAAQVGGRFADPAVEQSWVVFHSAHANLDVATASEAARRPRADETAWTP